jgi:hypothetical protein
MTLDVRKAFLDDAKEGGLDGLRQASKIGEEIELRVDAAAFAETESVFLESRDGGRDGEPGNLAGREQEASAKRKPTAERNGPLGKSVHEKVIGDQ